jgi:large subunit ribosomal protein L25
MRTVEIIGYKRANLGKSDAKKLRAEGHAPCVLYGGEEQIHFYTPMILFRDLVYTPEAAFVKLNIEGEEYSAILQDIQFHPVSEMILHADFLMLREDKPIKMEIPVKFTGNAPGVVAGGRLMIKLRSIRIKALPTKMPEDITLDISHMELGDNIKIGAIETEDFEILHSPRVTVAVVDIPRSVKAAEAEEEEEEELEGEGEGESEGTAEGTESSESKESSE